MAQRRSLLKINNIGLYVLYMSMYMIIVDGRRSNRPILMNRCKAFDGPKNMLEKWILLTIVDFTWPEKSLPDFIQIRPRFF